MAALATVPGKGVENYRVVASKDDRRRDVFCVLLKRTYDIHSGYAMRAEHDRPLRPVDVYYDSGDPETCSVQYENDLSPFKIATDVVAVGTVHAPGNKPTQMLDAAVHVAEHCKTIRVFGDRQCFYNADAAPSVTDPLPFTRMPMRYERAYGGTDASSIPDFPFAYPRNHLGCGFVMKNSVESVHGLKLPNFEDPFDLLTPERIVVGEPEGWWSQPMPQSFGWFQRTWYPRCSFVGSVPGFVDPDAVVREEQLGLVPKRQFALARQFKLPSFDIRFNNGASPGLALPFLKAGESVRLLHLTPDGLLAFEVPHDTPKIAMDIGLGERELKPVLQTLLIRPDDGQLDLIWRGAHEFPGVEWLPEMSRLNVEID
ncbi:MAG TPA: DUF2169 domain-containing protein [Bryobacteraceae bacterium]|nr:DUF2169 domain-containing protein [Bryobacteraceae bacterium]